MLALTPPVIHWYSMDKLTTAALAYGGVALLGTSAVLAIVSYYFSKFAGEMSYNTRTNTLKIAALTFWGSRKDMEFPAERVVAFVEAQTRMGGVFQRLEVRGCEEVYLWSLQYGRVLDFELLRKVLKITDTDLSHFYVHL